MATDYWPQEEGYIVEGAPVMMCRANDTIVEMACVNVTAGAAGYVQVDHSALMGDSIAVALRACTVTGQYIPVAFRGIVKMLADSTIIVQQTLISQGTDSAKVVRQNAAANVGSDDLWCNYSAAALGTAWIMGLALQAGITDGDEILMLLNPT